MPALVTISRCPPFVPLPAPRRNVIHDGAKLAAKPEVTRLADLSPDQWRSGIAAWLGWLFDGLDMHLYTVVALPFVAQLLDVNVKDKEAATYSSIIQASFLVGWALGGAFFGRIGDRMGRSRALMLTILTYAVFTGLSVFAQTWWHLMIFRFLAALGIGGEWAVGAVLSETWPRAWRPWLAAVLQTAVNCGILLAMLATFLMANLDYRYVFLVGIFPALITLWIQRAVPETEEWHAARLNQGHEEPSVWLLFTGDVRRTTLLTILVCSLALTAHWAFSFWSIQHVRNLPDVADWTDAQRNQLRQHRFSLVMIFVDRGQLLRRRTGAANGLSQRDRAVVRDVLCFDDLHLLRSARSRGDVVFPAADGSIARRVRAVHHVHAAVVSGVAAHDRRRLLLQHRPHRRRGRNGIFRIV